MGLLPYRIWPTRPSRGFQASSEIEDNVLAFFSKRTWEPNPGETKALGPAEVVLFKRQAFLDEVLRLRAITL